MTQMLEWMMLHVRWADRRTEASLRAFSSIPDEAIRLFAHVATAERIYILRMRGEDPFPQDFWPDLTLDEAARTASEAGDALLPFVRESSDVQLQAPVRYRNSKGTYFKTPLVQMLMHLSHHGEHHRGQIARIIREAGGIPAVTDFISFVREEHP
ncbi:MAG: DinB family protein [Rhodothermales bacterium]